MNAPFHENNAPHMPGMWEAIQLCHFKKYNYLYDKETYFEIHWVLEKIKKCISRSLLMSSLLNKKWF